MKCQEVREQLALMALDEGKGTEPLLLAKAVEARNHLRSCSACQAWQVSEYTFSEMLRRVPMEEPPVHFKENVMRQVRALGAGERKERVQGLVWDEKAKRQKGEKVETIQSEQFRMASLDNQKSKIKNQKSSPTLNSKSQDRWWRRPSFIAQALSAAAMLLLLFTPIGSMIIGRTFTVWSNLDPLPEPTAAIPFAESVEKVLNRAGQLHVTDAVWIIAFFGIAMLINAWFIRRKS